MLGEDGPTAYPLSSTSNHVGPGWPDMISILLMAAFGVPRTLIAASRKVAAPQDLANYRELRQLQALVNGHQEPAHDATVNTAGICRQDECASRPGNRSISPNLAYQFSTPV